ncbi:trypsin isoform X2 [Nilaparvata lugens]|uniref:Trypsin-2 n=1 Tax=Nilaparvata lugens TaxID=108931 RepID=A0A068F7A2_NILLU|nr:trypsin isoform X2 [Nilaparvata lugens]AID60336.1 trypsin-2 [Nilaparvata lugens]AID60340.1 trypsin-6 [Nilaparvata lugens]
MALTEGVSRRYQASVLSNILIVFLLTTAVQSAEQQQGSSSSGSGAVTLENERSTFLEWLSGLLANEEEPTTPPAPVTADECKSCKCGIANTKTRIVGGQVTYVNQYPWMALLMYNNRFYCGGSLISNKYVLTAAHCVSSFNKKKISVRLLEHDRDSDNETMHIDRKVARIVKHPGYSDRTFNNDIAIIQLDEDVDLDGENGLRPVCLPPTRKSFSGAKGVVTGWGVKNSGGSTSPTLNEVTVPILSNKSCRNTSYGETRITDNMLCAGYPEGKKDSCQGDSGGPLHVVNGTRYDVVGVVSWGEGCALADHPGVYTRVNRYITWLRLNTRDGCFCQQFDTITHKVLPEGDTSQSPFDEYTE